MIRTLICCAMSLVVSTLPSPPADDRPHLAVAISAARFIQASAVATPNGTAWPADPADPRTVTPPLQRARGRRPVLPRAAPRHR